ncbi:PP2C family serine/threonine-protein phosphatase [Streptomyces sp. NPDC046203]|uniref:PP2C family serine/threonine-protein phosphatase n=1 Tax=Streptomyces sp. NPDC046203 TaxID=3154602 RepID=UPI00340239A9
MSLKPQPPHPLGTCPVCAEPLESGDRFCGACGYDLSAAARPRPDRPTVPLPLPVDWPEAPPRDPQALSTATQHPGDLPGVASGGGELPAVPLRTDEVPGALDGAGAGVSAPDGAGANGPERDGAAEADGPEQDGDFTLAAPDPRAALQAAEAAGGVGGTGGAGGAGDRRKVCVACRTGRVDRDGYCEHCGHAQPRERDHMERELPSVAAVSDRGLRHHRNEDSFSVAASALPDGSPATIGIVCDGVSSATRPDEASEAAAAAASAALVAALPAGTHPQTAMHEAIVAASEAVNALAAPPSGEREHQNAPACTIVGSVVAGEVFIVGWVGDSRAYWVPDDRSVPPARLTEDDSWAAQMVSSGLMTEAQAYADERAHAITGWLGADAYELEPHTAAFKPDRPGVVLVCTDGLWNYAEGAEDMARVLPADASARPLHAAQVLVGHALDGGGHDNITVALLPFALPPEEAEPAV